MKLHGEAFFAYLGVLTQGSAREAVRLPGAVLFDDVDDAAGVLRAEPDDTTALLKAERKDVIFGN